MLDSSSGKTSVKPNLLHRKHFLNFEKESDFDYTNREQYHFGKIVEVKDI